MSDTALAPLYIYSLRTFPPGLQDWVMEREVSRDEAKFLLSVYRAAEPDIVFLIDTREPDLGSISAAS